MTSCSIGEHPDRDGARPVLLNAIIGFSTERQAESRIAGLLNNVRLTATVRRDGRLRDIHAEEVVIRFGRGSPNSSASCGVRGSGR